MAVIVVGKRQHRSERRHCSSCGALLEYLRTDIRIEDGLKYVDCPVRRCKKALYLGTASEEELSR